MTLDEFKAVVSGMFLSAQNNKKKMEMAEDMALYDIYVTGLDEQLAFVEYKGEGYLDGQIDALLMVVGLLDEVEDGQQV